MKRSAIIYLKGWLLAAFAILASPPISAQETDEGDDTSFSVLSFRALPNDVSAFVSPVRDLNGEACALVKVVAPTEFAFSTPLGIVKREDKTGEIWLYLPEGTKTLTIKHPQWGVLRDCRLRPTLESRVTYELRLRYPQVDTIAQHDTVIVTKTITDTLTVIHTKPPVPLATHLLLTSAFHADGPSFGLLAAMVWRHGFFVHGSTEFRSIGDTRFHCDKAGNIDGQMPYYTGKKRHSHYTVTAGAAHRLCNSLTLFEGIGYGRSATAWQLAESEGGGYALNDGLTHKGVAVELGLIGSYKRLSVSASVITIKGKQWQGCIGVGIKLGKQ